MQVEITNNPTTNDATIVLIPETNIEKLVLGDLYFYDVKSINLDQSNQGKLTINLEKKS